MWSSKLFVTARATIEFWRTNVSVTSEPSARIRKMERASVATSTPKKKKEPTSSVDRT